MAPPPGEFVDHYALLGCPPDAAPEELKRAYFDKIRKFHPDKRPDSAGGHGIKVAQALNVAWEALKDPGRREAYDALWRRASEPAKPSLEAKAEEYRHDGNELYKAARAIAQQHGPDSPRGPSAALHKYRAAAGKYSLGIELAPRDHRLRSNRALCYAALRDWAQCREDALCATKLKPDFMKGWFLLVKSYWKDGFPAAAQRELEAALRVLPGNAELLALQSEIAAHAEGQHQEDHQRRLPQIPRGRGGGTPASRSVSPACTPTEARSRISTPPPISRPAPPASRSPTRSCAGSRSPGPAHRQRSPSPGVGFGENPALGGTAHFGEQTAKFGVEFCSAAKPQPWVDPEEARGRKQQSTPPRFRGSSFWDIAKSPSRLIG